MRRKSGGLEQGKHCRSPDVSTEQATTAGEGGSCIRTCDPSALEGLGDDGCGLVLGLAKGLAELLHTVSVHDDGVPAGDKGGSEGRGPSAEDPEGLPGKGLTLFHCPTAIWERAGGVGESKKLLFPIWVVLSLFTLFHFLLFALNRVSFSLLSNSKLIPFIASLVPDLFISYWKLLWGRCTGFRIYLILDEFLGPIFIYLITIQMLDVVLGTLLIGPCCQTSRGKLGQGNHSL